MSFLHGEDNSHMAQDHDPTRESKKFPLDEKTRIEYEEFAREEPSGVDTCWTEILALDDALKAALREREKLLRVILDLADAVVFANQDLSFEMRESPENVRELHLVPVLNKYQDFLSKLRAKKK